MNVQMIPMTTMMRSADSSDHHALNRMPPSYRHHHEKAKSAIVVDMDLEQRPFSLAPSCAKNNHQDMTSSALKHPRTIRKPTTTPKKRVHFYNCPHKPVSEIVCYSNDDLEDDNSQQGGSGGDPSSSTSLIWWSCEELKSSRQECKALLNHLRLSQDQFETYLQVLSQSFKKSMPQAHVSYCLRELATHLPPTARGLERRISSRIWSATSQHRDVVLDFQDKLRRTVPHLGASEKAMLLRKIATFSSRAARQLAFKLAEYDAAMLCVTDEPDGTLENSQPEVGDSEQPAVIVDCCDCSPMAAEATTTTTTMSDGDCIPLALSP